MSEPASRLENLKTLRIANIDAAFATAFATLVSGVFLVGFIRKLGGSDQWIGWATAIPSFIGLVQIPGAILGRSRPSYKAFVAPGGALWRLLYVPLIFLPFAHVPAGAKLGLLLICILTASAATQFVGPMYNDWLAELVPPKSRGWFFSRRNAIAAAVGALAGLAGGFILDQFSASGNEMAGYSAVFGLGVAFAAVSMFYYMKMRDTERANPIKVSLAEGVRAFTGPLQDKEFRAILFFFTAFFLGQAFAGNLNSAFYLESLKMPVRLLQTAALMQAVGNVSASRFWGFLSEKYGNKPILAIAASGLVITQLPWILCVPGESQRNAVILLTGHFFIGVVWAGVGICQFNLLLSNAKSHDRTSYIGLGQALQAVMGGIGPILGATLMTALRGQLPAEMAYRTVFITTSALRFGSLFLLIPVREEGSDSIRKTIGQLWKVSPKGYRALHQLTSTSDVAKRELAMEDAASKGFQVASTEVVKALHDPSPRIRRQAAQSLSKLGDERAVEALLHQLREHPDLVEEETVTALGDIGHSEAIADLINYTDHPRSAIRRAAARALGQIGDGSAIDALINCAMQTSDPDLRRSALQALRKLGATSAEPVICEALLDQHPSVRIAAAEAVTEMHLTGAREALRASMKIFGDEAESEVAYALGCIGLPDDIPLILESASRCVSMITRRRCLLGIASLLGVETQTYRLMLLEGMARDAALLELSRGGGSKAFRKSIELFSTGKEQEAIRSLPSANPFMALLASVAIPETFLIAIFVFERDMGERND